jgi:hypothetical protein
VAESGRAGFQFKRCAPRGKRVAHERRVQVALVDRASQSHNVTRDAGPWSRAILLFADGRGLDVTAKRDTLDIYGKMAIA